MPKTSCVFTSRTFQPGYQTDRIHKSKKEKEHQDNEKSTGDRCIQIVATVHFDPELLSRDILER